ncbi:MAG: hypothetical protein OXO49_07270 [Gammaproteobacteria bacterium]|nr:hypothetical protein [Gammaproteobacteria bacterium]MDE0252469.1 hypothetical protein [Gammaproteobacteria bacterium]MDE0402422.1 hypothetical protein [Gammaproteobacteria bacterium]
MKLKSKLLIIVLFVTATSIHSEWVEKTINEKVFDECVVHNVVTEIDEVKYENLSKTRMKCESKDGEITVNVSNDDPDEVFVDVLFNLDIEDYVLNHEPRASSSNIVVSYEVNNLLVYWVSTDRNESNTKLETHYKPEEVLNKLAKSEELKFEFSREDSSIVKTVKLVGSDEAVQEFRKRVKKLKENKAKSFQNSSPPP